MTRLWLRCCSLAEQTTVRRAEETARAPVVPAHSQANLSSRLCRCGRRLGRNNRSGICARCRATRPRCAR